MPNSSLSQIILFVEDMAKAVWFYRDVLGFPVRYPSEAEDLSNEMWVELDSGGCALALHGGAQRPPEHQHELVFKVDNLEGARAELLRNGIEVGEIHLLEDGLPVAKGVDPAGHHFSIR